MAERILGIGNAINEQERMEEKDKGRKTGKGVVKGKRSSK